MTFNYFNLYARLLIAFMHFFLADSMDIYFILFLMKL